MRNDGTFTFDEDYEMDKEGLPDRAPGRGTGSTIGLVGFREPYKGTCPEQPTKSSRSSLSTSCSSFWRMTARA